MRDSARGRTSSHDAVESADLCSEYSRVLRSASRLCAVPNEHCAAIYQRREWRTWVCQTVQRPEQISAALNSSVAAIFFADC